MDLTRDTLAKRIAITQTHVYMVWGNQETRTMVSLYEQIREELLPRKLKFFSAFKAPGGLETDASSEV